MRALGLAILAGSCWGVGELCTRSVLVQGRIGPLEAIAIRSTVALPLIWAAYLIAAHGFGIEGRWGWPELPLADRLKLVLGSGLLAGAAGMIFFYAALHLGEISRVKPIAFTVAPAIAALLGWLLLGESMSPRKLLALGLICLGVLLLTTERHGSASSAGPAAASRAGSALLDPAQERKQDHRLEVRPGAESVGNR
jgi:transporter family protein